MYKRSIFSMIFVLFIISSCGLKDNPKNICFLSSVVSDDKFFTDESFFNAETTDQVYKVNSLDAWVFGLRENSGGNLRKNTNSLKSHFTGGKKPIFSCVETAVDRSSVTESQKLHLIYPDFGKGKGDCFKKTPGAKLFPVFNTTFDGEFRDYSSEYFKLLDEGYCLYPVVRAEVVGPEWVINGNSRFFVVSNGKSRDEYNKALRAGRTYISTAGKIGIEFNCGGFLPGSVNIVENKRMKFEIKVKSPEYKIERIEVVSNNSRVVEQFDRINKDSFFTFFFANISDSSAYYILKIYCTDGKIAFTSPVWLKSKVNPFLLTMVSGLKKTVKKGAISVGYDLKSCENETLKGISVTYYADSKEILSRNIDLKPNELKHIDEILEVPEVFSSLRVSISSGEYKLSGTFRGNSVGGGNVIIDISHGNIFSDNMSVLTELLRTCGYNVKMVSDKNYFSDYANIKDTDLIIYTIPRNLYDGTTEDSNYIWVFSKYVNEGGAILMCGYNDENAVRYTEYLNRILTAIFSPIKFRTDRKNPANPVFNEKDNFGDKFTPVFQTGENSILTTSYKIYLRNPIDIYAHSGTEETAPDRIIGGTNIVPFSENTMTENRKIYKPSVNTVCAGAKVGNGYIAVMSGINFTDTDIELLDNKKFILQLINKLSGE